MPNIRLRLERRALVVALALSACPTAADPPGARAAAEAAARTFRDWRIACDAAGCAIRTALRGVDGSEVLTVSAAGIEGAGALMLRSTMPLFLPDGLTVGLGDAPRREVAWRTCDSAGCAAETPLAPDLLDALKREQTAEVALTLVDGVRVRLPVSLSGFTAAWEALGRLAAPPPISRP